MPAARKKTNKLKEKQWKNIEKNEHCCEAPVSETGKGNEM